MTKYAFVTGAAKRLGKDIANHLAQQDYHVIIHYYQSKIEAENLQTELSTKGKECTLVQGNIKDPNAVMLLSQQIKKITSSLDLLIYNIGNYTIKGMNETSIEEWKDIVDSNLNGAFYCFHYLKELLLSAKGQMITIGYAGVENIVANSSATAYQASKTALLVLTKSIAKEFAATKLRANMVSPGQLEYSIDLPKDLSVIPLGLPGKSQDIIQAIDYLVKANYVTGVNIDVAGGYRLSLD